MRKPLSLAAAAAVVALWALPLLARNEPGPPSPTQRAVQRSVERLLAFDHWATGQATPRYPPVIKYATPDALGAMYGCPRQEPRCVLAVTLPDGTIVLDVGFEPGRDDAILAHELVHFMQYSNGSYRDWSRAERKIDADTCPGLLEPEAYRAQGAYVLAVGRGVVPDEFTVLTLSLACAGPQ
jgi:hypothetical protein